MKLVPVFNIMSGGKYGDALLRELYDKTKQFFPKGFAQKYRYSGSGLLHLPLEEGSDAYNWVLSQCTEKNLSYCIFENAHFTKSEIEQSEFFDCYLHESFQREGTGTYSYGTKYTGCPYCVTGELLTDIFVNKTFVKKSMLYVWPERIINEELANKITKAGFTGIEFDHRVWDYKGRDMPVYYRMHITNILPPMSESTWLYHSGGYCDCGQPDIYLRSPIKYKKEALQEAKDFNLTCEHVNNIYERQLVVSKRVRDFIIENKVYSGFDPIIVE